VLRQYLIQARQETAERQHGGEALRGRDRQATQVDADTTPSLRTAPEFHSSARGVPPPVKSTPHAMIVDANARVTLETPAMRGLSRPEFLPLFETHGVQRAPQPCAPGPVRTTRTARARSTSSGGSTTHSSRRRTQWTTSSMAVIALGSRPPRTRGRTRRSLNASAPSRGLCSGWLAPEHNRHHLMSKPWSF
jgi:hypothetical protein